MTPAATLTIHEHDGLQIARLQGEVDLANAAELLDRLLGAISSRSHSVVLDLTVTRYLDSAGLRLIFETRRALRNRRQALRVVAAPATFVADVLEMAGFEDVVPIHASVADALDAISRSTAQG